MMELCCCANILDREYLKILSDTGFRYYEPNLCKFLAVTEGEAKEARSYADSLGLTCASFICLFPGEVQLFGREYAPEKLREYLDRALSYAAIAGAPLVTLGSGKARTIPEGMRLQDAKTAFCDVLTDVIAPAVKRYGMKLGIEPLRADECNFLNTCAEIMEIVKAVDLPEVNLTVDCFHASVSGESYESMAAGGDRIIHVHLASAKNNRCFPQPADEEDLVAFFGAMKRAGYNGPLSVEGKAGQDKAASAKLAYETMKAALARI